MGGKGEEKKGEEFHRTRQGRQAKPSEQPWGEMKDEGKGVLLN